MLEQETMEHERLRIDIHEHISPLRERMSKMEGRLEGHEKEITLLRQGLDSLRDKMDVMRRDVLASIDKNHQEMLDAFKSHEVVDFDKDDEISRKVSKLADAQQICAERLAGLKAWVVGIGVGAALIVAGVQFFYRLHNGG
jgi:predicted  nucleic acid-binding Zn-ribbon protein